MGILDRLQLLARASRTAAQSGDGAGVREQIAAGQQSVADLRHELERLRESIDQARKDGELYEDRAANALRRDDEDAARAELRRKVEVERHRDRMIARRDELLSELTQLEDVMTELAGVASRSAPGRAPARPARSPGGGSGYYQRYRQDTPDRSFESRPGTPKGGRTSVGLNDPTVGYRRGGTPGWQRPDDASTPSTSSDPFERFDSFAERVESGLANTEAEHDIARAQPATQPPFSPTRAMEPDLPLRPLGSGGAPNAGLEREFDKLEADRDLRALKDRARNAPRGDDPLARLRSRLADDD